MRNLPVEPEHDAEGSCQVTVSYQNFPSAPPGLLEPWRNENKIIKYLIIHRHLKILISPCTFTVLWIFRMYCCYILRYLWLTSKDAKQRLRSTLLQYIARQHDVPFGTFSLGAEARPENRPKQNQRGSSIRLSRGSESCWGHVATFGWREPCPTVPQVLWPAKGRCLHRGASAGSLAEGTGVRQNLGGEGNGAPVGTQPTARGHRLKDVLHIPHPFE